MEVAHGPGVAVVVRRVALAFRGVGLVWMAALALVRVAAGDVARPGVVLATVAAAAAWTVATLALARREAVLRGWPWPVADVVVACAVVVGPALAGEPAGFAGGYPFTAVVLGAWGRGLAGALAAAAALTVATSWRVALLGVVSLPEAVQNLFFYVVGAAVLSWAIAQLQRDEVRRLAAEAALGEERAERARSQERAETAAHLHDSVLQTLALVQRRAGDATAVRALARRQERELRAWLFGGRAPDAPARFADAVRDAAEHVEAVHGLSVSVVAVGDAPLDPALDALVAAAREALTNAAKHAGVPSASLYAEVADGRASVFVRDRGHGFDPAAVPEDRAGLRTSIEERVRRHGGTATVQTAPGEGTEVRLAMPLAPSGAP